MGLLLLDALLVEPRLLGHHSIDAVMIIMEGERYAEMANSAEAKALLRYKHRLLVEVVLLLLFCLLIVLERIFYQMILHSEQESLAAFQIQTHLAVNSNGRASPADILDPFYAFWASLSAFNIQFLILTHAFLTMYVLDSALAGKVMMASLAVIQSLTFLQLIYAGARPYWTSPSIFTSHCNSSFTHPDLGTALLIFVPLYAYYCWTERSKLLAHSYNLKCNIFGISAVAFAIVLILFLNYVTGSVFGINITLSLLLSLFACAVLSFLNSKMDRALQCLENKQESRSQQIKWVFFIIISVLFVEMTYSNSPHFQDTEWISNHLACKQHTNKLSEYTSYDKILGPWFTFKQTGSAFAWIALVLALPFCHSKMSSRNWSRGTMRQRALNIVVCNLLIAPSWVFELLIKDDGWIKEMGANSLMVDSLHYFLLYMWLFGLVPPYLLSRVLKTVESLDYSIVSRHSSGDCRA